MVWLFLTQACIDDNLEMVEFLVQRGADVNRGDNEGWTPLHATASCGFLSIAKFLLEAGADVAAVNNDGELAIDISESDEMEDLLQKEIDSRSINCEEARNLEEQCMLNDARDWYNSGGSHSDMQPVLTFLSSFFLRIHQRLSALEDGRLGPPCGRS